MPCPFPGMDPYLERREIWADFHDNLIARVQAALQPLLRPRYVAVTQDRIYVEEIREPLIHIVETASGNRLVTAMEVLSPTNKETRNGRTAYLQKSGESWEVRANLVEIDLWPGGEPIVRVPRERLESLRPWRYVVAVRRFEPPRQEVYRVTLDQRLPRVGVPLGRGDADVPLDLQGVFGRCWEEGPYPELLRYDEPPPGDMTAEEARWAEGILRSTGMRGGA